MSQAALSSFEEMQRVRAQLKSDRETIKGRRYPRRQLRPGSRLFAKYLDMLLIGMLLAYFLSAFNQAVFYDSYSSLDSLSLLAWLMFPLTEAVILKVFGNTPGKALFRLTIRDSQGKRPGFGKLLSRSYLCWFYGLSMGLPIISLITMYCSRRHLLAHGVAGWDARTGLLLVPQEISARRETITILVSLIVPLLLTGVAIIAMMRAIDASFETTFSSVN